MIKPEKKAGKQIVLEDMAKALDKLCIDNLCDMQQTFEKQVGIMHGLLYEEMCNVMDHTMMVMELCSGYSGLVKDLLKSDGQIDIKLVYSHFTKIRKIFGEIANSFGEDETG